jgi:hypothetical protein
LNPFEERRVSPSTLSLSVSLDKIDDELIRFRDFCRVDKNLVEYVAYRHTPNIRKFLQIYNRQITIDNIREYLLNLKRTRKLRAYSNILCSFKRYFRDYKNTEMVNSFEFPKIGEEPKIVPSKEQLKLFFDNLPLFPRLKKESLPKYQALFFAFDTRVLVAQRAFELLPSGK